MWNRNSITAEDLKELKGDIWKQMKSGLESSSSISQSSFIPNVKKMYVNLKEKHTHFQPIYQPTQKVARLSYIESLPAKQSYLSFSSLKNQSKQTSQF
jgi:hypothetical protein